jgi:hypothetical protein
MFTMDESRVVAIPMEMKLHKRTPKKETFNPTLYYTMI